MTIAGGPNDRLPTGAIARPGRNCWRIETASRAALLIDTENYFNALAQSIERAERSILIAGWDFDSRLRLRHGGPDHDERGIARLLSEAALRHRHLRVHLLLWDFPIILAPVRELLPLRHFNWRVRGRVKLHYDSRHPIGASHHQKLVVIDDRIAYVGGIDLTVRRWDTSLHLPHDPRRIDIADQPYSSYHDVQLAVEGDAAEALGELFRERWRLSAGTNLFPESPTPTGDPWPQGLVPDLSDVPVAIARTDPLDPAGPVREVEDLHLEVIASARRYLYFENQFFTATRIGDAIAARLREPDGPEVVVVSADRNPNWFESRIMEGLRNDLLIRLRRSDLHGRLRVYYPRVGGEDGLPVFVHSKVTIADDRSLRVGSANLANRSMGLDTECDLFIEDSGDGRVVPAAGGLLDRLLAEHLGAEPAEVRRRIQSEGSLIRAIEGLHGGDRTLEPVSESPPEWLDAVVAESLFLDPEEPPAVETLVEELIPAEMKGPQRWRGLVTFLAASLAMVLLVVYWGRTPTDIELPIDDITRMIEWLRETQWGPLWAVGFVTVGGLALLPESVLFLIVALIFGAYPGMLYSLVGSAINAAVMYGVGRALGRKTVYRLARHRVNRINRRLSRPGIGGILTLRLYPAASFAVTNLVAGVSGYRLKDFVLGTAAGMAPEVLLVSLFGLALRFPVREPSLLNLMLSVGAAAVILSVIALLRGYPRTLRRQLTQRRRAWWKKARKRVKIKGKGNR